MSIVFWHVRKFTWMRAYGHTSIFALKWNPWNDQTREYLETRVNNISLLPIWVQTFFVKIKPRTHKECTQYRSIFWRYKYEYHTKVITLSNCKSCTTSGINRKSCKPWATRTCCLIWQCVNMSSLSWSWFSDHFISGLHTDKKAYQ